MKAIKAANVNDYIAAFPEDIQLKLSQLRKTIRTAAPKAEESISYQIPAYKQNGVLVYFAAFNNHISFFPTSSGIAAFKKELAPYAGSKGTVRFPLTEKLPLGLIKKIVKFRVIENEIKKEPRTKSQVPKKNQI